MALRLVAFVVCLNCLFTVTSSATAQETEAATRQYAVAVGFQNQGLFDSAIDEWKTFLTKFPTDPRVSKGRHYLGTCCLQEKRYPEAIAAFNEVLKKFPKFELLDQSTLNLGIAWYGQARKSAKDSDYTSAERAFGQMLEKFPESPYAARALYYRGECLFQLKQIDKAEAAYAEFVRKYADDELAADALYALGTSQELLKKTAEATATYALFAARHPKHSLITEIQMRRAEILFDAQKFAEAKPIFELVTSVKDFELADVAMLRQARCLYETGQLAEAGRLYWNVPRQFRTTKHYDAAILAGAKCYFLKDDFKLARTGLEKLVDRKAPEAAEATQWLARCYLKEGNAQKALDVASRGIQKFTGTSARPELELVRIDAMYEIPAQRPQAAILYSDFSRKNPQHELAAQAQYMAALTLLDLKNYADAKKQSDLFVSKFGNSELKPDVLFISAESQLLLGEHKDAVAQYREFLKTAPTHGNAAQATVRLGLALFLSDQHQEAVSLLQPVAAGLGDKTLRGEAYSILGRSHASLDEFGPATDALQKSIADSSEPGQKEEARIALAATFRKMNRDDDANAQLQTLLKESPRGRFAVEANFRLAESAYANERYKDAIQFYAEVNRLSADSEFVPHALYGQGWTLFNLGEYKAATETMTQLIAKHGRTKIGAKGYYVRAMAAYQLGEFEPVLRDVDAFVATQPDKTDVLDAQYVKGLALAGLKKFDQAAAVYQSILADSKDYAAADKVAYELGWSCIELGQTDNAVAAFERLAKEWPNSPLAPESLFRVGEAYYDAEKYPEAVAAYETSAKTATGEIAEKSFHKLGWSYVKAKNVEPAVVAFREQLNKFPNGELAPDARFLIGECSFQKEDWDTARKAYEKVIADQSSNYVALAMFRAGECAASMEDWRASREWHSKVLEKYPDFEMTPEARYGLAWALQNEGKFDKAIPLYEQVTEETQTETGAKARFMIGECLFAQKQHKEATKHFLKTAFLYNHKQWSAMAYFEAGRCFEVLRDTKQARNCYEQLIEKYPQHKNVQDARRRLAELK